MGGEDQLGTRGNKHLKVDWQALGLCRTQGRVPGRLFKANDWGGGCWLQKDGQQSGASGEFRRKDGAAVVRDLRPSFLTHIRIRVPSSSAFHVGYWVP